VSQRRYDWLEPDARIHFVGIGGIGLSAIARVFLGLGYRVSGSDLRFSQVTDSLRAEGGVIREGHSAENVAGADLVVVSSAVPADNPELRAAEGLRIPVVKRDWVLGRMMQGYQGITVAGTHGKTTTTSMIAYILDRAGWSPTFIVGGIIGDLDTNARSGTGRHFVVEADEYDRCFLGLRPHTAVVTNIEMDHPDCYGSLDDVAEAFSAYLSLVPEDGRLVICGDSPTAREVLSGIISAGDRGPKSITYGLGEGNDWRATGLAVGEHGGYSFDVWSNDRLVGHFETSVPGRHNVTNSLAALCVVIGCGLDVTVASELLSEFRGVRRRFEFKGSAGGVLVFDDYAHHPTEIRATLRAAREHYPGRDIWAVFQPHTYTRTRALMESFATSFGDADHVVVTDIYAARERDVLGVHASQLVGRMSAQDAHYGGSMKESVEWLLSRLKPGSFVITLGAGSVTTLGPELLQALRLRLE